VRKINGMRSNGEKNRRKEKQEKSFCKKKDEIEEQSLT